MFRAFTSLFRNRAPLRLRDGRLREMVGEGRAGTRVIWEARVVAGERPVPVWLSGSEAGVDANEREIAIRVIERLPDFVEAARLFLTQHPEFYGEPPLTLYAVSIEPSGFVIEFLDRAEDGVWRAEFDGDRAVRLGFDD